MADDGMLVNFDIGPDAFVGARSAPSFKGGKWTDRQKAKRLAQYHIRKGNTAAAPKKADDGTGEFNVAKPQGQKKDNPNSNNSNPNHVPFDRSLKRKRPSEPSAAPRPNGTGVPPPGTKPGEFVSSLWTQNPASVTIESAPEPEPEAQAPTNAPLSDGSTTFTTLGLSPILANHLTTKLTLKAPTAIQKSAIPELIKTDSDAFIQAETGSGKTLTYLLPIVNRVMQLTKPRPSSDAPNGKKETMARHSGLYAIILAPTRELSRQIETVLSTLIHAKNGPHWIVPGSVIGGEKKKSEKARLRKGLNILVATPGRLLDHLENTESLDVSRVRWVVMDEGDRLMELGFEETIGSILAILEKKSKLPNGTPERGSGVPSGEEVLPKRRVTILCSATMKTNVQRLGDISLKDALYIKAEKSAEDEEADNAGKEAGEGKFTAPAQLKQSYAVVPAKQRLVALMAVLKRAFIRQTATPRVMVFFSCSDSVDFHFEVFSRKLSEEAAAAAAAATSTTAADSSSDSESDAEDATPEDGKPSKKKPQDKKKKKKPALNPATSPAPTLHPSCLLHKLHGSLPQPIRTAALHSFTTTPHPTILFCTDVAARGLDLPNIDLIIQHDPPFSPSDHLHRIGRTARAGRPGRATIFLLPGPEEGYVDSVLKKGVREGQLARVNVDELFRKGFAEGKEKKREWEDRASEWQLDVERWIAEDAGMKSVAARAWGSHIRAYATHVGSERAVFSVKGLHYGHLAKSFGLRDKPGDIKVPGGGGGGDGGGKSLAVAQKRGVVEESDEERDERPGNEAMRKMRKIAQGMLKKRGMADEFNIG
ncbi:uncharacterized protein H6S33_002565 [Morchella sextelata]|uniref:uncharacterized protein n=1 Tax=Morchella sextelata TaxID=1174677 RepID=UPI001D0413D6|nr:uncharacterized protein H6S33_002565 [Morchella sextelata]KAH0607531.1 hypothetical protein H6S33_002565 [Morchella sextelata]